MSITFDTERWSSPWRARDIEEAAKQPTSPRVVTLSDLPYFKGNKDIAGDAYFRRFTGDDESDGRKKLIGKDID